MCMASGAQPGYAPVNPISPEEGKRNEAARKKAEAERVAAGGPTDAQLQETAMLLRRMGQDDSNEAAERYWRQQQSSPASAVYDSSRPPTPPETPPPPKEIDPFDLSIQEAVRLGRRRLRGMGGLSSTFLTGPLGAGPGRAR